MRHALVIAPNWIGDALMAQPLLTVLKKLHPRITLDVVAPSFVAPVMERMPEVSHVITTDFGHGGLQWLQRRHIARDLRDTDYDAAFVLPNSFKSALIPWMANIRLRIGYRGEYRYGLLNVVHAAPSKKTRPPMVAHYTALAYAPGARLPEILPTPKLDSDLNEAARVSHRFTLDTRVPLIVLCPGAEYGPAKRWPPEHFARLAILMRQSFPYAQIVALGSQKDAPLAQAIVDAAPFVRNLCGQTALGEACALIGRAALVVSNDSGLMHVAAALRRPLVALYGSTDPRHTPPLSEHAQVQWLHLECSPCFARECPLGHMNCLRQLAPEQVFASARQQLLARE